MSSVTLKITSLFVRTISKPIANRLKAQAREHEGFRRLCISLAQSVHRVDMRLRLGLLQDTAAIDKQIARDASEAAQAQQARKARGGGSSNISSSSAEASSTPTVKTEAQAKADDPAAAAAAASKGREKKSAENKAKHTASHAAPHAAPPPPTHHRPRIRPLSEAKAIDSGANFISETFLFAVGLGCVLFETWRARRKEKGRREDVAERLAELEARERDAAKRIGELVREGELVGEGEPSGKVADASTGTRKAELGGNARSAGPVQSAMGRQSTEGSKWPATQPGTLKR